MINFSFSIFDFINAVLSNKDFKISITLVSDTATLFSITNLLESELTVWLRIISPANAVFVIITCERGKTTLLSIEDVKVPFPFDMP